MASHLLTDRVVAQVLELLHNLRSNLVVVSDGRSLDALLHLYEEGEVAVDVVDELLQGSGGEVELAWNVRAVDSRLEALDVASYVRLGF